jgi:hypothetical protein
MVGLAGCSQQQQESTAEAISDGPGVNVTAAPGVAFNYRYAFRLPTTRIAALQEEHAQACERLGVARCRITGMRYRVMDEDRVSAMLALKLDPSLARQFGKDASAAVRKAEGMLVDSEITGTDVGIVIARAGKGTDERRKELARIEAQLGRTGVPAADRARLQSEVIELRRELRTIGTERSEAQESLATTPMVFEYGAGGLIPGFEGGSPLGDAFATAARSFVTMLSFIIVAVGALAPWALAGLALWALARSRAVRRVRDWLRPGDELTPPD